ncbi:MAG: proline iminopeptidase [Gaiellaceae bacterium]|nr:proline iminopeptidase [Gaiellaceae bacterium]
MREGHVDWRAGQTWYGVAGDGPQTPLLCLHGGPGSTHHYFAPLYELADERPVILYDQLGCGGSRSDGEIDWSVAIFLEELDALRGALGLDRVHLLGTSWGGMLALEHVLARQDTVASLVLSSTLASAAEWTREVKRLRDAIDIADDEAANEVLESRHVFRGDPEREELRRMKASRGAAAYEAMWGPNEWTVTGALQGWDVRARLAEIHVPTLVIRGGHDLSTPLVSRTLVQGIAGAREVVLDDSSHMPVLEETERYLGVLREFLALED